MSLVDDLLADLEENEQVEDDNASVYTVQNTQHGLEIQNSKVYSLLVTKRHLLGNYGLLFPLL